MPRFSNLFSRGANNDSSDLGEFAIGHNAYNFDDMSHRGGFDDDKNSAYFSDKVTGPTFHTQVFQDTSSIVSQHYYQENTTNTQQQEQAPSSSWQRVKDSFKPADFSRLDTLGLSRLEKAAIATANYPLARQLKGRHLRMIAITGPIGTGLFLSSGLSLVAGGPGAVLVSFLIIGIMVMATIHALGELAVCFPVAGAYTTYATRFIDPAWGFAMGWNCALRWLIMFPLELVAASITIKFWTDNTSNETVANISPAVWIAIFYVIIIGINMLDVRGYGETEFIFALFKVLALVAYMLAGIVIASGHGPKGVYIHESYWKNPGSFKHGFKGVVSVLVNSAFSFTGTELIGLTAAETANPRKDIPSSIKRVFWKIAVFYIGALSIVCSLVSSNDFRLIAGSSSFDTSTSPFVISLQNAGLSTLGSIFNGVVLISIFSVSNACIYACSRTVSALAAQGQAPRVLGYIDRSGRPLAAIGLSALFGLIAFSAASGKEEEVLFWLLALSGLSCIMTWCSISISHIRFRMAMKIQGRSTDEIWVPSMFGIWGSCLAIVIDILVIMGQFWVGLFPLNNQGKADPKTFFQMIMALPIMVILFLAYKFYYKTSFVNLAEMDLDTGRRETDMDLLRIEIAEERERARAKGILYRIYRIFF